MASADGLTVKESVVEAVVLLESLTVAWTLLFALTTVALLILFYAAPPIVWSAFANFGAPALMALMFALENWVRRLALPGMEHAGLVATIRASAAVGHGSQERRS